MMRAAKEHAKDNDTATIEIVVTLGSARKRAETNSPPMKAPKMATATVSMYTTRSFEGSSCAHKKPKAPPMPSQVAMLIVSMMRSANAAKSAT